MSRAITVLLALVCLAAAPEAADEAIVVTDTGLSVTGLADHYGPDESVELVVRPPQHNVVRARTEVVLIRGDLEGQPVVQEVRKYDRYSNVVEQRFTLLPSGIDRAGDYALLVRVRGLRTRRSDDTVEPFEEKMTYRLTFEGGALVTEASRRLEGVVLFDLDSSALDRDDLGVIDRWAAALAALPGAGEVRVEGHADRVGTPGYNLWLSRQRARVVRAALIERGAPGHRVQIIGAGFARPYVDREPSGDERGVWENRRAEVVWFPPRAEEEHP